MTEEKGTKVVPCKWYSEVKYQGNYSGLKSRLNTYLKKYCKCNCFRVTTDLLKSENLKVAIAQLCYELQVYHFTIS